MHQNCLLVAEPTALLMLPQIWSLVGFLTQRSAAPGSQPALSVASDLPIRLIVICENMREIRRSARIDSG